MRQVIIADNKPKETFNDQDYESLSISELKVYILSSVEYGYYILHKTGVDSFQWLSLHNSIARLGNSLTSLEEALVYGCSRGKVMSISNKEIDRFVTF